MANIIKMTDEVPEGISERSEQVGDGQRRSATSFLYINFV